jgi:hypothetical protein
LASLRCSSGSRRWSWRKRKILRSRSRAQLVAAVLLRVVLLDLVLAVHGGLVQRRDREGEVEEKRRLEEVARVLGERRRGFYRGLAWYGAPSTG